MSLGHLILAQFESFSVERVRAKLWRGFTSVPLGMFDSRLMKIQTNNVLIMGKLRGENSYILKCFI